MIEVILPGRDSIQIHQLVCDVNGTLALDGRLLDGVMEKLNELKNDLEIHLVTANTNGKQTEIDSLLGLNAVQLKPGFEAEQKEQYLHSLGAEHTAAIGQGANDRLMLKEAVIGICVLSHEGAAPETLAAADLVMPDILSALDLFAHPLRITATLRR